MIREMDLVDDYAPDYQGWARFNWNRKNRFRLGRAVSERAKAMTPTLTSVRTDHLGGFTTTQTTYARWLEAEELLRVVFVLLNPSMANAFADDRTVSKCVRFAELWGFDVAEIVNLWSIRTPYPEDMKHAVERGDGPTNDEQILHAISRPNVKRVVAGWGRYGSIDGGVRAEYVTGILQGVQAVKQFEIVALRKLPSGAPIHPLSRGKEYIPFTIEPVRWP